MKPVVPIIVALATAALSATAAEPAFPAPTGRTFAHTFPYSMVGQLFFDSGSRTFSGTATVIRPSSALTAAHNLYDFDHGWSTKLAFHRGRYRDSVLAKRSPNRLLVLAGYQARNAYFGGDSIRSFAADTGAMRFSSTLANGGHAGWTTDVSLLTGEAYNIVLGYGGEKPHTGNELLFVEPPESFYQVFNAFFENDSIYVERGMSGGPVFALDEDGLLYVCGTVVSGADDPISGGIRVFNQKVADLINNYLR